MNSSMTRNRKKKKIIYRKVRNLSQTFWHNVTS